MIDQNKKISITKETIFYQMMVLSSFKKNYDLEGINMICKICGVNETDNPDGICDDCKFSMIGTDGIPPTF